MIKNMVTFFMLLYLIIIISGCSEDASDYPLLIKYLRSNCDDKTECKFSIRDVYKNYEWDEFYFFQSRTKEAIEEVVGSEFNNFKHEWCDYFVFTNKESIIYSESYCRAGASEKREKYSVSIRFLDQENTGYYNTAYFKSGKVLGLKTIINRPKNDISYYIIQIESIGVKKIPDPK